MNPEGIDVQHPLCSITLLAVRLRFGNIVLKQRGGAEISSYTYLAVGAAKKFSSDP